MENEEIDSVTEYLGISLENWDAIPLEKISTVEFNNLTVTIIFRFGLKLEASAHDEETLDKFRKALLKRIEK